MRRAARRLALAALALLGVAALLLREPEPGPTGRWLESAGLAPRLEVVEGVRVRYVEAGSGPAVLLLHGFASSIYTWKDVVPALARERRVVALDFPGFGGSETPPDLSFAVLPRVATGLLDRLGIARASLVGNSMGGAVGVVVAARRPERMEKLVLIDAAGYNTEPSDQPWIVRLVRSRAAAALLEKLPVRRRPGLRQVFQDPAYVTPERIDEYVTPLLRPGSLASIRSLMVSPPPSPSVAELAPRVEAPTLIVWGRHDRWIPLAHAARFAAAIPGSRTVVLDDCGHLPQEERPGEVVRLLEEFLQGERR
jgi:pimeloyl-ACP methyl ester carboxylesterase